MLDAFIIEKIKSESKRRVERPQAPDHSTRPDPQRPLPPPSEGRDENATGALWRSISISMRPGRTETSAFTI